MPDGDVMDIPTGEERIYREAEEAARQEELEAERIAARYGKPSFWERVFTPSDEEARRELPIRRGVERFAKEEIEEAKEVPGMLREEYERLSEEVERAARAAAKGVGRGARATAKYLAEREELRRRRGEPRGVRLARGISRAMAPSLGREERRLLYFGRPAPELYGMAPRRAPAEMIPAGRAMMPAFGAIRELTTPRGLGPAEQAVWAEVEANGDHDTLSHIISQLRDIGLSGKEVADALKSLLRKGLAEPAGTWEGEREYGLVRRGNGRVRV